MRRSILVSLTFLLSLNSYAEDWPRFLGPRQDQTSLETEVQLDWTAHPPKKLWETKTGTTYSTPVVADGRLISFHRLKDEAVIDCLNAETGEQQWRFTYPTAYRDQYGYNNGPRAAPLIHEGKVYTLGAEGVLTCLDLKTGGKIWQRELNREYEVEQNFFGVGSAPVISGEILLVNVGGKKPGTALVGMDRTTGKTIWESGNDPASYSTPTVHTILGKETALFFTRTGLLVADPKTGVILHDYYFRSKKNESVNASCPLVVDDIIFLSAAYRTGAVALQVTPNGLVEIWKDPEAIGTHWNTCHHVDGYLYGNSGRHESEAVLRCIEFKTGKIKWTAPRGLGRTHMIKVQDRFIVLGERGFLAQVKVTPEKYEEIYRAPFTGTPSWSPPILCNGLLYIRDENQILCLDIRK